MEIYSLKELKYKMRQNLININDFYIIACSSCADNFYFLPNSNNIFTCTFDDVKKESYNSFNFEIAQNIKNFVDKIPEKENILVCCDAGLSRSPAIAAAILEYLDFDFLTIWENPKYSPNTFVFKTLTETFGKKHSEEELQYFENINKLALHNLIEKKRKEA